MRPKNSKEKNMTTALNSTQSISTKATEEVAAAVQIFMDHVNRGDLENMLSMYSSDASILSPNGSSLYGEAAFRPFW
jgi:ketosteroid isomerase-like protein